MKPYRLRSPRLVIRSDRVYWTWPVTASNNCPIRTWKERESCPRGRGCLRDKWMAAPRCLVSFRAQSGIQDTRSGNALPTLRTRFRFLIPCRSSRKSPVSLIGACLSYPVRQSSCRNYKSFAVYQSKHLVYVSHNCREISLMSRPLP